MKLFGRIVLPLLLALFIADQPARSAGETDTFGYTLQPVAFDWDDITHAETLVFPSSDNSFAGPLDLGFDFPFYEHEYSQVFVSTNGVLSFGQGVLLPINMPIPSSPAPNDIIAVLWADLDIGGVNEGEVYTLQRGAAPNREFVVEYFNVTLASAPEDLLTFEVTLHENGDICVQYLALDGDLSSMVAGIEDIDGVDGLDAGSLIDTPIAYCHFRPPDAARGKITPAIAAGFVSGLERSFEFTVHNTGALGTDLYELSFESDTEGWTAEFFLPGSQAPLTGAGGTGIADTGPIVQGASKDFIVTVSAPAGSQAGDYAAGLVQATSQMDSGAVASMDLQIALAVPFVQIFREFQLGLRLEFLSPNLQTLSDDLLSGNISGFSVAGTETGNFFAFSEDSYLNSNARSVTDIEFSILSPAGQLLSGPSKLTNNNTATLQTRDRLVSAAGTPDGRLGVVYIRNITDSSFSPPETNSNLYLTVLDPDGTVAAGPVNVTQNSEWRNFEDVDVPVFDSPRIAAVGERYAVTWIDNRLQPGDQFEDDVLLSIVTTGGAIVVDRATIADSNAGGSRYSTPSAIRLEGDRVMLVYGEGDSLGAPQSLHFTVRDEDNTIVLAETALPGAAALGVDGVQLLSGNILIAWIEATTRQVNYALLDESYALVHGPVELLSPANRRATSVSVTVDPAGRAVLTWADASASQYLFYALIDHTGEVVTPPMGYRDSSAQSAFIFSSAYGAGNAAFGILHVLYMPIIVR